MSKKNETSGPSWRNIIVGGVAAAAALYGLYEITKEFSNKNEKEAAHSNHDSQYIFVYGTLKNGEPNHDWVTDTANGVARFIGAGETVNQYPLVIATKYNLPCLLHRSGTGHFVKGEVYEVDEKMLNRLDVLDDHPNLYERSVSQVRLLSPNEDRMLNCWIYFFKEFEPRLLNKTFLTEYTNNGDHGLRYCEKKQFNTDCCSICLTNLPSTKNCNVIELQCGHSFHRNCIARWLETQPNCPICRMVEDIPSI